MYYTIYKTINQLSGKYYVGIHRTNDIHDDYLGSGKFLLEDIEIFGKENFIKKILYTFDTEDEMIEMEKQIVDHEFVSRNDTYNKIQGGTDGYRLINQIPGLNNSAGNNLKGVKKHQELLKDPDYYAWFCNRVREGFKKHGASFTGRTHTEETKKKMSKAKQGKYDGKANPNYGNCWIYSLKMKKSKQVPRIDLRKWINEDWTKGRKMKF